MGSGCGLKLGRRAGWRAGAIGDGVVRAGWRHRASNVSFNGPDLTLWLVAGLVVAWWRRLAPQGPLTKTGMLQDTLVSLHLGQDTLVKTRLVAPILSAPLLTDLVGYQWGQVRVRTMTQFRFETFGRTRRVRGDPGDAWRSRTMTLFRARDLRRAR